MCLHAGGLYSRTYLASHYTKMLCCSPEREPRGVRLRPWSRSDKGDMVTRQFAVALKSADGRASPVLI